MGLGVDMAALDDGKLYMGWIGQRYDLERNVAAWRRKE